MRLPVRLTLVKVNAATITGLDTRERWRSRNAFDRLSLQELKRFAAIRKTGAQHAGCRKFGHGLNRIEFLALIIIAIFGSRRRAGL